MNNHKKTDRLKGLLPAMICALAAFSLACNTAPPPQAVSNTTTDPLGAGKNARPVANEKAIKEALDVPITKLDGSTFKLADFQGKVLVVDFWATYCGPCVKQAPQLAAFSKRYRDRGVEVIGLTFDEKSDQGKVTEFINGHGVNYTIGYANNWISRAFIKGTEDDTGSPPIPQQIVIARDGSVVEHLVGDSPQRGIPYLEKVVSQQLSSNTASN